MRRRNDLPFWQVPLSDFQSFDHGAVIKYAAPKNWDLQVGDIVEYEAGQNISGTAEVTGVEPGETTALDFSGGDGGQIVPGTNCIFKKRS
jgi:hypothetical protein